jgi:hypothetical protein
MFWQQLDWVQLDMYVSDGRDTLTILCKEEALFETVHRRLTAALNTTGQ